MSTGAQSPGSQAEQVLSPHHDAEVRGAVERQLAKRQLVRYRHLGDADLESILSARYGTFQKPIVSIADVTGKAREKLRREINETISIADALWEFQHSGPPHQIISDLDDLAGVLEMAGERLRHYDDYYSYAICLAIDRMAGRPSSPASPKEWREAYPTDEHALWVLSCIIHERPVPSREARAEMAQCKNAIKRLVRATKQARQVTEQRQQTVASKSPNKARWFHVLQLARIYGSLIGRKPGYTRDGPCAVFLAEVLSRCEMDPERKRNRITPKRAWESWGEARKQLDVS